MSVCKQKVSSLFYKSAVLSRMFLKASKLYILVHKQTNSGHITFIAWTKLQRIAMSTQKLITQEESLHGKLYNLAHSIK